MKRAYVYLYTHDKTS